MSRFFRLLKATLYKEWKTLLSRGLAGLVGFVFVVPGVMLGKALSVADTEPLAAMSGALFAIFVSAMVGMLATLRFWEEKGYGTLESLFALPYGVRSLFLAKLALPFLVGFFISCVFIVFNLLWLPSLGLGRTWAVCMVAVTAVSGWVLAFESVTLVGYAMWMMSETAAKWAQMVVMGFYGGAMALPILGVSVSIGALLSVLSAMVLLLGVLCFFALRALSTERIVLNA